MLCFRTVRWQQCFSRCSQKTLCNYFCVCVAVYKYAKKNDISRTTTVISSEIVRPLFEGLQGDQCYEYLANVYRTYRQCVQCISNVLIRRPFYLSEYGGGGGIWGKFPATLSTTIECKGTPSIRNKTNQL